MTFLSYIEVARKMPMPMDCPIPEGTGKQNIIFPEVLKAQGLSTSVSQENCPLVESLAFTQTDTDAEHIPESLLHAHALSSMDWRKAQQQDPTLKIIIDNLEVGSRVSAQQTQIDRRYLKEWEKYYLSQDVLYRRGELNGQQFQQLVLPLELRDSVFEVLHDDLGHQGRDQTTSLLKQRFYWPGIDAYMKEKIQNCDRCIKRKAGQRNTAELENITSTAPKEILCLDYLSLERCKGGVENILVIMDHFTRYAQAIRTTNQTAKTTAFAFDNFVVHYGFPARLHSDQGQIFVSKLIEKLCKIAGTEKSSTTPYHPMGNGQCECYNQTLLKMLGIRRETGNHMFHLWFMPTTQLSIAPLVTLHIF